MSRARVVYGYLTHQEATTPLGQRVLEPLRDELLQMFRVGSAQRVALRTLSWPAQLFLLRIRFPSYRWNSPKGEAFSKWRDVRDLPDPPKGFSALAWTSGLLLASLSLALGGTRLVSGVFRWQPLGMSPWGPAWLAIAAGSLTLLSALAFVVGIRMDDFRPEARSAETVLATALVVELVCMTYVFVLALLSGRDLVGWLPTCLGVGLLGSVTTAATMIVTKVNEKRNNQLRTAVRVEQSHRTLDNGSMLGA